MKREKNRMRVVGLLPSILLDSQIYYTKLRERDQKEESTKRVQKSRGQIGLRGFHFNTTGRLQRGSKLMGEVLKGRAPENLKTKIMDRGGGRGINHNVKRRIYLLSREGDGS